MMFWSFPGGEVEEIGYIRQIAAKYGASDYPGVSATMAVCGCCRQNKGIVAVAEGSAGWRHVPLRDSRDLPVERSC